MCKLCGKKINNLQSDL